MTVEPVFRCSYGAHVRLGDRVFVNHDALFMDDAPITVGDDARLGPRVQLLTAQHPVDDPGAVVVGNPARQRKTDSRARSRL